MQLFGYTLNYTDFGFLILGILFLISFTWNIINSIQISKVNKKYKKFMRGASGKSFEQMLLEQMECIDSSVERVNLMNQEIINLKEQMDRCIQKVSIVRYNAFKDTGSDLSYSIAMMDNFNNGIILTGIYGRNECVTYAKPIENGISKYPLSVEEELALGRCIKKNSK